MEINEKDLASLMEGVAKKNGEYLDGKLAEINQTLEKQGEALRKVGYNGGRSERSIDQVVTAEALKGLANGERRSVKFKIDKTNVTRASVSSSTLAARLEGVGQLATMGTRLSSLFNHVQVGPNSNGRIVYIDQSAATRNADFKAEAAQKPESAITWVERSLTLEKVADTIPVTKEALNDVNFIRTEIDRLLNTNIALKVDEQLYDGDGNTPNLKGVYTSAGTFNALAWTGPTVYDASIFDLIAIMSTQISSGYEAKYSPDFCLMHPHDFLRLQLAKDSAGRYLLPSFVSANGAQVFNMQIIPTAQVTQNTMVVGDSRYGTIYDLDGVTVEVGYIDDQFVKNTVTILAEQRLGLLIRTVDEGGFLKCTNIGTAIAQLSYS